MLFDRMKDYYEDYLENLRKKGMTEKTIGEHRHLLYGSLSHSIQNKYISRIKVSDTADVIEAGRKHGKFGPQRSVLVFRNYLRYLKERGISIPIDPRDIHVQNPPEKEQPVFEEDEALFVLELFPIHSDCALARGMAWTMRTVCEVQFATGMRIHEVLTLRREQFKQIKETQELLVLGKGKKWRTVRFGDRAIEWLEKYLAQRTDTSPAMFVNVMGSELKMATVRSYYERFKKRIRQSSRPDLAEKMKTHTWRRTLATFLMENGADIKSAQNILGHASERTTLKHYVRTNARRAKLVHKLILSQFGHDGYKARYREINGKIQVRLTENKIRWMELV